VLRFRLVVALVQGGELLLGAPGGPLLMLFAQVIGQ
jgi:hypothetical protein